MASLVDYLNSQKQDSSFSARSKLATQYGIKGYTGTAAQNTQLLGLLQKPTTYGPTKPVVPSSTSPNTSTGVLSGASATGTGNITFPSGNVAPSYSFSTVGAATGPLTGATAKPTGSVSSVPALSTSVGSAPLNMNQPIRTPNIPQAIPSDLLQRSNPISLPEYKEPALPSLSEYLKNTTVPVSNQYETLNNDLNKEILFGIEKMGTKGEAKAKYEQQFGLPAFQQQLNELNAQMNALTAEATGKQLDSQGKAIANTFINRQVDAIEREKTVKALGISAAMQAMQGNVALAADAVSRALEAEFSPIESRLEYLKAALEMNKDNMSRAEKKAAEEQALKIKEYEMALNNQKTQKQNVYDIMTKAAESGADSATLNKIMTAKTAEEAVVLAGSYLRKSQNQVIGSSSTGYYEKQPDGSYRQVVPGENGGTVNVNSVNNISAFMEGIAKMESGGNYKAIGPAVASGDRAYGKYQIMGNNIPSWTREALGQSLTIQQFLNSPEAQEATARYKMEQSYNKYGNWEDVASVWFSGRPLSQAGGARDVIGTSVPKYVQTVMAGMRQAGGGSQLSQTQIKSIESSAEYKKINALADLQNKINTYRDAVDKTDRFAIYGANKATLDALYADLKIAYKEAANLGALTGPDVAILQEAIKPMSGITNYTSYVTSGSKQGVLSSIDSALKTVNTAAQRPMSLLNTKYANYIDDPYFQTVTGPFSGSGYASNGYVAGSNQADPLGIAKSDPLGIL